MNDYKALDLTKESVRAVAETTGWDFDAHVVAGHLFSYGSGDDARYVAWQFMSEATGGALGAPTPYLPDVLQSLVEGNDLDDPYVWEHWVRFATAAQVEDPSTGEQVQVRDWLRGGGDPERAYARAEEWA